MIAFLAFSLRRAWEGFWRNKMMSLAATATMVFMLILVSGLAILLSGLDATLKYVERDVEVVAYLQDSATPQQVSELQVALKERPQVTSVAYVSKEQALADFEERQPDAAKLVATLPSNPLPASLDIKLRNPSDYVDVADYLRARPEVEKVQNIKETVDQMLTVTGVLRTAGLVVLVLVGLIALFVIVNSIRLAVVARAEEIEIMRLVGASDAFIRWPFLFEGAMVGLFGAAITLGLLWLVREPATSFLTTFFDVLPVQAGAIIGRNVALLVLGTGLGIGVLGSYVSVRSYLHR